MSSPLDSKLVKEQIEILLGAVAHADAASPHEDLSGGLPKRDLHRLRVRLEAAAQRLLPPSSSYAKAAAEATEDTWDGRIILRLAAILEAWRSDVQAGYLHTLEELVRADLFADFLEMSDELLTKGYKDAAAVVAGAVLEQHLRKLGEASGISYTLPSGSPKKADTLNSELASAGRYNKLTQKSLTALLDLRNKAAHGHYDEYDAKHVEAMLRDVRSFLERHPVSGARSVG